MRHQALGLVVAITLTAPAPAQLPNDPLPAPMTAEEVDRLGADLRLSLPQRLALDEVYEAYLDQGGAEWGRIMAQYNAAFAEAADGDTVNPHHKTHARLKSLILQQVGTVHRWDEWLFDQLVPIISESQQPRLARARASRSRILYRGQRYFIPFSMMVPADLSVVIRKADIVIEDGSELDIVLQEYERRVTPLFRDLFEARADIYRAYTAELTRHGFAEAPRGVPKQYGEAMQAAMAEAIGPATRVAVRLEDLNKSLLRQMQARLDPAAGVALLAEILGQEYSNFQAGSWRNGPDHFKNEAGPLNADQEAAIADTNVWYRQRQLELLGDAVSTLIQDRRELLEAAGAKGYGDHQSPVPMELVGQLLALMDSVRPHLESALGADRAAAIRSALLRDYAMNRGPGRPAADPDTKDLARRIIGSPAGLGPIDREEFTDYVDLLGLDDNQQSQAIRAFDEYSACTETAKPAQREEQWSEHRFVINSGERPFEECESGLFESLARLAGDDADLRRRVDRVQAYRRRFTEGRAAVVSRQAFPRVDLVRLARALNLLDDEAWRGDHEVGNYEQVLGELLAARRDTIRTIRDRNEDWIAELDRLKAEGMRNEVIMHQRNREALIAECAIALRDRNRAIGELNETWLDRWGAHRLRDAYERICFPEARQVTAEVDGFIAELARRGGDIKAQSDDVRDAIARYREAERENWRACIERFLSTHPMLAQVRLGIAMSMSEELEREVLAAQEAERSKESLLEQRRQLAESTLRRLHALTD